MTATTEWYRQEPIITFRGGCDFDFRVELERVNSTSLDDKITDITRVGAVNLTGYTEFTGELRSFDGTVSLPVTIMLDGQGTEGAIRIKGNRRSTWALQQAGVRAGQLTVRAKAPDGGYYEVVPMRWNLKPGSTSPLVVA